MAFNDGSLLQVVTQDTIFGLRDTMGAFADRVCKRYSRDALSGSEPIFPTSTTLGQDKGGQAPGATIKSRTAEISSVDYKMLEYPSLHDIAKASLTDLSQYMEPLGELTQLLVRDVDAGIDVDLLALLSSGSLNQTQGAGAGNWSVSTSTPILDLQNAVDKSPGADMLILGHTSARELSRHPDLKERTSNYTGAGSIGFDMLRSVLAEALEIDPAKVYVFSSFYNSANEGQTPTLARVAGDLAWVGHQDGLRMYEQNYKPLLGDDSPQNAGLVSVADGHNRWEIAYRRVLDIVRGDVNLGVTVTGL